jgi:RNA polymerase sigma-70 factor (ECF subfamily)
LILIEAQDRSLWNRELITEGIALVRGALASGRYGAYTLQATLAAVHSSAPTFAATDWPQIVALYDRLLQVTPSPVIELNRAVAVAMRDGPAEGLTLIDALLARGELNDYHHTHSARGELLRRLGRAAEARAAYEQALNLAQQGPERRLLERRLAELKTDD